MSGHRRGTGKPKATVLHVRRRSALHLERVAQVPVEHKPAAAFDAVRRELAAMDPRQADRFRRAVTDTLLAHARSAAQINEGAAA